MAENWTFKNLNFSLKGLDLLSSFFFPKLVYDLLLSIYVYVENTLFWGSGFWGDWNQ
jgi:hypothetical protein